MTTVWSLWMLIRDWPSAGRKPARRRSGDGHGRAGQGGNLRGDVEDNQALGVDVRDDVQDDADVVVLDGVDGLAGVGQTGVGDEGDFLADFDAGKLVVRGQDVRPGEHVELAGLSSSRHGGGHVAFQEF